MNKPEAQSDLERIAMRLALMTHDHAASPFKPQMRYLYQGAGDFYVLECIECRAEVCITGMAIAMARVA